MRIFRRERDLHALAGVYALDALEDAERERFERHLVRCRTCEAEVRGFTATATALAMATTVTAPETLRPRVLAGMARTRQLPPVVEPVETTRRRRTVVSTRSTGSPTGTTTGWRRRLALPVAAAALAAVVALVVVNLSTSHELDSVHRHQAAVAAVLSAPDARLASARTTAGGTATVVSSAARGELVFTSAGLRSLPSSRTYELWLLGPGAPRSAGLLPPARDEHTAPVLASGLAHGDKVAVTVEPAGGSEAPTTTPIVVMTL